MRVDVQIDHGKINKLSAQARKAVAMTAEQLRTEVIQEQVIPFDEGTLQNVQTFVDMQAINKGQVQIVHDTPYAARLYFNPQFNFSHDTNANARGEWWEPWLTGTKKARPSQLFRTFYKNLTGV